MLLFFELVIFVFHKLFFNDPLRRQCACRINRDRWLELLFFIIFVVTKVIRNDIVINGISPVCRYFEWVIKKNRLIFSNGLKICFFFKFYPYFGCIDNFSQRISLTIVHLSVIVLHVMNGNRFGWVSRYWVLAFVLIVSLNEAKVLSILDFYLKEIVATFLNLSLIRVLFVIVRQWVSQLELLNAVIILLLSLHVYCYFGL